MIEPVNGMFVLPAHPTWDRELKAVGAKWSASQNAWTLPGTAMNARVVNDMDLRMDDLSVPPVPVQAIRDERLYPYQADAAERLAAAPHGMLVCLSPGLGKTAVAIKAADQAVPDDKVVVVAPASLLQTWRREIEKWADDTSVYVMEGKPDYEAAATARWIVTSWDKAVREEDIWGRGWPLWILDESVLVKNRSSKRFKTLQKIRRKSVDRFWLLSGSPTTRHADDLWAQLHLLWPRAFPSYWRFAERYTVVEDTPWARTVTATRAGRDAAAENGDLVMVVNQEDVLDLPEYLFEPPLMSDMRAAQAAAYASMRDDFVAELGSGAEVVAANEIARLTRLQQIASVWDGESGKHDDVLDVLGQYEPPFLFWTHWRESGEALSERLRSTGLTTAHVDGGTSRRDRDSSLEGFKADTHDALVLSLGVGKFGHTLTNVRTVFSVDRNFNADDYFQSMHRVRRIGLKHRPVVVPVVARGTVDELTVGDNLEQKLGSIARMTRANLADLLKGMGR